MIEHSVSQESINSGAIVTFTIFFLASLFVTIWASKRSNSKRDFYIADQKFNGLTNGFAIAGDTMSAASFLGLTGLIFVAGFDTLIFITSLIVSWLVVLILVAEKLKKLGAYTLADVIARRLSNKPIRILCSISALTILVPYLLAQMVAAGALVQAMFGIPYPQGVICVGVLITFYVGFGGMLATTWVQIIKAVLLLSGGTLLAFGVLQNYDFSIPELLETVLNKHPAGINVLMPGGFFRDTVSVFSLSLAFVAGTAAMPHVLMRFFTVPDPQQARKSALVAFLLITYFQLLVVVVGLGSVANLIGNPDYYLGGTSVVGGSNMVAIHLSKTIGGDVFMGFISAVAFVTIIAVVSGITLSAGATVSHDLCSQVFNQEEMSDHVERWISRTTVVLFGVVGVLGGILLEGQNVAVLATLPLVIGASTNFPLMILAIYWEGLTTRGALYGGYAGLFVAMFLLVLGPNIWVAILGQESPIFPFAYPTVFSLGIALLFCWWFSKTDNSGNTKRD